MVLFVRLSTGAVGNVTAFSAVDDVEPVTFVAVTTSAYDLPGASPMKVAFDEPRETAVVAVPSRENVYIGSSGRAAVPFVHETVMELGVDAT